jgi:hypothetical protein
MICPSESPMAITYTTIYLSCDNNHSGYCDSIILKGGQTPATKPNGFGGGLGDVNKPV